MAMASAMLVKWLAAVNMLSVMPITTERSTALMYHIRWPTSKVALHLLTPAIAPAMAPSMYPEMLTPPAASTAWM